MSRPSRTGAATGLGGVPEPAAAPPLVGRRDNRAGRAEAARKQAAIERLALRLGEAAVALGLSRRTVERLRASGRFPKPDRRVGKVPLWSRETLAAWIKEGGQA